MFTIKTQVGRVFGSWLLSAARFSTADKAQAYADDLARAERLGGMSTFTRRVVAL